MGLVHPRPLSSRTVAATAILAAALLACVAFFGAARAGAMPIPPPTGIEIHEETTGDEEPLLGKVKSMKCMLRPRESGGGKSFFAFGYTADRQYELTLSIRDFAGFGRRYTIFQGETETLLRLFGPGDRVYSNEYTQAGVFGGGAIAFAENGRRIGAGYVPAFDESFEHGVTILGGARCARPKR